MEILNKLKSPSELKKLSYESLDRLANELRGEIITTVSKAGGHLASNLGVVELTIALHRVFNSPEDKIIWDVGHQSYVHKLLTGRHERFSTLRSYGGISGFTMRSESEHDPFGAGHSSTSISAALGFASADALNGSKNFTVAITGDGAFTNGMIYEALNNCSKRDLNLVIVLNDNDMSINTNVGAFAEHLARFRTSQKYFSLKHNTKSTFEKIPGVGEGLVKVARGVKNFGKRLVWSENIFEHLGVEYLGPVNGNDIKKLEIALNEAKKLGKCCLVHVQTKKGKGYDFAERNPSKYHSVGAFDPKKGVTASNGASFSSEAGKIILDHAQKDKDICAITAAMTDGTGLSNFAATLPDRFFDVGIAEEHAVTFAAGLAASGKKPVAAIYSTFLQRTYDQIIHDVALQKLPVVFAVDRAGMVNSDGATHHGLFDVAMLRNIPSLTVFSPETYEELEISFSKAFSEGFPSAVRYPKGKENSTYTDFKRDGFIAHCDIGKNPEIAIITYGIITKNAYEAAKLLSNQGVSVRLIKLIQIKPIDFSKLGELLLGINFVYVLEEGIRSGGIGEQLKAELDIRTVVRAVNDRFVTFGDTESLHRELGFLPEQIAAEIKENVREA